MAVDQGAGCLLTLPYLGTSLGWCACDITVRHRAGFRCLALLNRSQRSRPSCIGAKSEQKACLAACLPVFGPAV